MKTVKDILKTKGSEVVSVGPNATLLEALEKMADKNVGAVLVVGEGGDVQGLFSERDFARKIIIKSRDVETTKVCEVMTSKVLYVTPATSISDCMNLMTKMRVRHLPVILDGKPAGIISIGDVVKAVLEEQELLITRQASELGQLERYVDGSSA
jgi:CBS domain-containing protein